jgi:hypothetical protein
MLTAASAEVTEEVGEAAQSLVVNFLQITIAGAEGESGAARAWAAIVEGAATSGHRTRWIVVHTGNSLVEMTSSP